MTFSSLLAMFPCESLEHLDLQRADSEAEELLSAWSVLWHPALLAATGATPRWAPASAPPEPSDFLAIVPDCCEAMLPGDWLAAAESAGACVLRGLKNRREMLTAALKAVTRKFPAPSGRGAGGEGLTTARVPLPQVEEIDQGLAADFLALGYCHLQVELMTSRARYAGNLDEAAVRSAALAAARAALDGNQESARGHLQSAFDRLHESREYLHPTEPRLLNLTLVAASTLGQPLRDELAAETPCNLLVSGQVIEQMAQREPKTLSALQQALDGGAAALVGGEFAEARLPLLPLEAIRLQLDRGLAAYQEHLGHGQRFSAGVASGLPPRCRRSSAGWGSTACFTRRSTTAASPSAANAGPSGKASTAARSSR